MTAPNRHAVDGEGESRLIEHQLVSSHGLSTIHLWNDLREQLVLRRATEDEVLETVNALADALQIPPRRDLPLLLDLEDQPNVLDHLLPRLGIQELEHTHARGPLAAIRVERSQQLMDLDLLLVLRALVLLDRIPVHTPSSAL